MNLHAKISHLVIEIIKFHHVWPNPEQFSNCWNGRLQEPKKWRCGLCRGQKRPLWSLVNFLAKFTRPASISASNMASGLLKSKKTRPFCSFYGHDENNLHASGNFFSGMNQKSILRNVVPIWWTTSKKSLRLLLRDCDFSFSILVYIHT